MDGYLKNNQHKKDMLYREIKIIFIVFLFFCFSCENKSTEIPPDFYKKYSIKMVGEEYYNQIYKNINDTIINWKNNNVGDKAIYYYDYRIDSTLCFNKDKNKLITAALVKCDKKGCLLDDIIFLNGVKIKEKWYFFTGADLTLPREYYQKDIHKPLSFEKLHQIAMKNVFRGYLIQNSQGKWEVNNVFFDELKIGDGGFWFSRCKTQEDYEKTVDTIVNIKWKSKYL